MASPELEAAVAAEHEALLALKRLEWSYVKGKAPRSDYDAARAAWIAAKAQRAKIERGRE